MKVSKEFIERASIAAMSSYIQIMKNPEVLLSMKNAAEKMNCTIPEFVAASAVNYAESLKKQIETEEL